MVGVPGRSKACRTCRRRKKGCDLQQPSCNQCRKACIPCEGYNEGLIIQQYHGTNQSPALPHASQQVQTHHGPHTIPTDSSSVDLIESITLSRTARETGLEGLFWESYMPNSQFFSLFDNTQRDLGGSISVIRDISLNNSLLRTAMGAMILRSEATKEHSPYWMIQQATRLHVNALHRMRMALCSRRKHGLELLGAARVFSLYEALYGGDWKNQEAQYHNWRVHHSGDLALVVSNPPSYYVTGAAHRLFVDGRLNLVLCALKERKRLILSQSAWMTIPWTHHPKTRKDLLIDILLQVPSLYEAIDNMELQSDVTQPIQRLHAQEMAIALIDRLKCWNTDFGIQLSFASDWQSPGIMATDKIAEAHIMTLFWASNLVIHHAYRGISGSDIVNVDPDDCCRRIIHCIPSLLHPSTGAFRQHLAPFPLMAAARHLISVQPPKLQMERDYLRSLCEDSVFAPMHQFISSLLPESLSGLSKHEESPSRAEELDQ